MHNRISVGRENPAWLAIVLLIAAVALAPILAIGVIAIQGDGNIWPHLMSTILPRAARDTLLLLAGVGLTTLIIGTSTAWMVTMFRFPGQRIFTWLLLLPLAMPTYITAYCYVEIFDYSGPIQTVLRAMFDWHSFRDYWFPDIRSLGGAVMVISLVLYPYVYLTARSAFLAQSVCVLDVSRTLGHNAMSTFWGVALPLARPALAAGVTIALMETLNDIGAVEFFGVRTLTLTIYTTWLGRGSLSGAAQLACILLAIIFLLLWVERISRQRQRFHHTSS
ncbi:MAG: ABC transporter permease subunit, partial [Fimbriimonadaceae bacterium]|nr:ABC transporter permease subunit [Alphaproteobacteria bacterium]